MEEVKMKRVKQFKIKVSNQNVLLKFGYYSFVAVFFYLFLREKSPFLIIESLNDKKIV